MDRNEQKVWEPLFAINVRRKEDLRRTKRVWGPVSLEYIPWRRQTGQEKVLVVLLVVALICVFGTAVL